MTLSAPAFRNEQGFEERLPGGFRRAYRSETITYFGSVPAHAQLPPQQAFGLGSVGLFVLTALVGAYASVAAAFWRNYDRTRCVCLQSLLGVNVRGREMRGFEKAASVSSRAHHIQHERHHTLQILSGQGLAGHWTVASASTAVRQLPAGAASCAGQAKQRPAYQGEICCALCCFTTSFLLPPAARSPC